MTTETMNGMTYQYNESIIDYETPIEKWLDYSAEVLRIAEMELSNREYEAATRKLAACMGV